MKRHQEASLKAWYTKTNRKPLIIRGARQVGKSTLVRLFTQGQGLDLIEINLERIRLKSVEKQGVTVIDVIDEIQLTFNVRVNEKSIIFFDEIQEQPALLKFLRYFYEEAPHLAVISAGSLLEISLRDEAISFPVGRVEFLYLGPMTYSEFVLALGHNDLLERLKKRNYSEAVITKAGEIYRKFLLVGGMPEAVRTFVESKSIFDVRAVQSQILQTYSADFPKYNRRINSDRVRRIFQSIVHYLGQKIIYSKIDPLSQSRDVRRVVDLLIEARVLLSCVHTQATFPPLRGASKEEIQKLFFLDVGLTTAQLGLDSKALESTDSHLGRLRGLVAEQFVAQHLSFIKGDSEPPELFYWLRDQGTQKAEVDFLIEKDSRIIPVEVKSGSIGKLQSLQQFIIDKGVNYGVKLSLDEPGNSEQSFIKNGVKIDCAIQSIPIFCVEYINDHFE